MIRKVSPFIVIILFGNFWTKAASMLSLPFLAIYLSAHTTLSAGWIGFIVGCQPFAACLAGFWGGHLSDYFGRHRIILISLVMSAVVYFVFYLATMVNTASIDKVVIFSVLNFFNGLFSSFFSPVSQALISDNCEAQEKIKFLHARYLVANIGAAMGPVIGAYIGASGGRVAFLLSAILFLIYTVFVVLVIRKIKSSKKPNGSYKSLWASIKLVINHKKFSLFVLSAIFFSMAYAQITSNFSLILERSFVDGVRFFSWMCALNGLAVVAFQPLMYMATKNLSPRKVVFWGNLIFSMSCLLMALLPIYKSLIIVFMLAITLGEVLVVPTQSVMTDLFAPEDKRGLFFGAASLRQMGASFGPFAGGLAFQFFGHTAVFLLMTVLTIFSAFLNRRATNYKQLNEVV
ncbi:MAG: hypothetical protein COV52_04395 [Gammaproteobacteria bacterium CG11_big_fil_rev_8_21_14_0_20_46_22]|nr:MAG: hypothetical protein COV52_04395 [Gammaproteobacteria bacterium CG11_big_fil_rev_8_21_14_0_20_46_22]